MAVDETPVDDTPHGRRCSISRNKRAFSSRWPVWALVKWFCVSASRTKPTSLPTLSAPVLQRVPPISEELVPYRMSDREGGRSSRTILPFYSPALQY